MTTIGFLGLGRMGTAMATRLLDRGYDVTVWNRTGARTVPLVRAGATAATTPLDAASRDVVITMLADPAAVHEVVLDAGVAAGMRPGSHLVEMSTIGPEAVTSLATRMPYGVGLVDAPVMGSVAKARTGELGILAGGDVAPVAPVLDDLGSVTRCGALGSGAALKLVLMTAVIGGVAVVTETLRVADRLGVPREQALPALAAGPLAGAVVRATATGSDYPIVLAAKDLSLATEAGPEDFPVTASVRDQLRQLAATDAAYHDLSQIGA